MAYDSARARVVLHGGGAAAPATITAADLLADTWELPAGVEPGPGPEPGQTPTLVSFAVVPDVVMPGDTITLMVELDQPAPAATPVEIAIDGTDVGSTMVDAGQATSSASVPVEAIGLVGGQHEFTATLGAVTLTASLTIA